MRRRVIRWDLVSRRLALARFGGLIGRIRDLRGPLSLVKGTYHPPS